MLWNYNLSMRIEIQQLNKDESCFENYIPIFVKYEVSFNIFCFEILSLNLD